MALVCGLDCRGASGSHDVAREQGPGVRVAGPRSSASRVQWVAHQRSTWTSASAPTTIRARGRLDPALFASLMHNAWSSVVPGDRAGRWAGKRPDQRARTLSRGPGGARQDYRAPRPTKCPRGADGDGGADMDKSDVEPTWLRTTERVTIRGPVLRSSGDGVAGVGFGGGGGGAGQRAELMTGFICRLSPGRLLLRA